MGIFSSIKNVGGGDKIAAVSPVVGVIPAFIGKTSTTLVLKEKVFSLSGDDFTIKDVMGRTVLHCSARNVSMRDTKVITDAAGVPLFTIKNKLIAISKTFVAEDAHGKTLFTIKKKKMSVRGRLEADFHNVTDGKSQSLTLHGDLVKGGADIRIDGGIQVAHISRQFVAVRQMVDDKQTYYVTVAAGVDIALIAALCICFDEVNEDE